MNLTKMKRCQKAIHGYKGKLTGEGLFDEVEKLKSILGSVPVLVETAKYPGVKIPSWMITIEPPKNSRWGGGGANQVEIRVYVNDDSLLPALNALAPPPDVIETEA